MIDMKRGLIEETATELMSRLKPKKTTEGTIAVIEETTLNNQAEISLGHQSS